MVPGTSSPASEPPTVSIVLATLNERENLPVVLPQILTQPLPPLEVLVADDGSTDGTREYINALAARDGRIRPIYHDGKQTTLRAQSEAIGVARGSLVVVMDADQQHPPETLPSMVRALTEGSALVVASRYAPGGSPGRRTLGRLLMSRGAEWIAKALLAPARRVSDPVSGYFAFRREIWVPLDSRFRGYKLLLFVLVMATGRPVSEVGFRFESRAGGASKVTEGWAFIRLFLKEVRWARRLAAERRTGRLSFPPAPSPATAREPPK